MVPGSGVHGCRGSGVEGAGVPELMTRPRESPPAWVSTGRGWFPFLLLIRCETGKQIFFKKNAIFFNFLLLVQKIDVILTQKQQRTAPRGAQNNFTMNKKQITAALLAIAAANPEGFTVSRSDLTALNDGYAVAVDRAICECMQAAADFWAQNH